MPINKYVVRKEKAVTNRLARQFKKNQKALVSFLVGYETKSFTSDLQDFIDRFLKGDAETLSSTMKPIINKGANVNARRYNKSFYIDWVDAKDPANTYLQGLITLNLSQAQGSIGATTEREILAIIQEGFENKLTYAEIGAGIKESQPFIFSKSRAELIAVTEVGRAYEFGNWMPMKDLQDRGERVLKAWSTVGDAQVRASHLQNESDGYIPLDQEFSGTGDLYAPAKKLDPFRCRCASLYKLL